MSKPAQACLLWATLTLVLLISFGRANACSSVRRENSQRWQQLATTIEIRLFPLHDRTVTFSVEVIEQGPQAKRARDEQDPAAEATPGRFASDIMLDEVTVDFEVNGVFASFSSPFRLLSPGYTVRMARLMFGAVPNRISCLGPKRDKKSAVFPLLHSIYLVQEYIPQLFVSVGN